MAKFFLIFVLFWGSFPAAANWTVKRLRGAAWVAGKSGRRIYVTKGAKLKLGQVLNTANASRVQLSGYGSQLFVGSNSKIRLQNPRPQRGQSTMQLLYGKIRAQVSPKPGLRDYKISTKNAVAGVRGTEFFMSRQENFDQICTLKGLIDVEEVSTGRLFEVPMCAGIRLQQGDVSAVTPTPSQVEQQWISETSTSDQIHFVRNPYGSSPVVFHEFDDKWYAGIKAVGVFHYSDSLNYGGDSAESAITESAMRLEPSVKWGHDFSLVLKPRVVSHSSNKNLVIEDEGSVVTDSRAEITQGESYFNFQGEEYFVRAGWQSVEWMDGSMISRSERHIDPWVFPGARMYYFSGRYSIDVLAFAPGRSNNLTGEVPASVTAAKFGYLDWVSVYLMNRSYSEPLNAVTSSFYQQHDIFDFGVFSDRHFDFFDYKAHVLFQNTKAFKNDASLEDEFGSQMYDFEFGVLPFQSMRLSLRWIMASENFIPGFESRFNLGYSRIFNRSNIEQYRAALTADLADRWSLIIEGISSFSLSENSSLTGWSGKHLNMAQELDVILDYKYQDNLSFNLSYYYFDPGQALDNLAAYSENIGSGGTLILKYSY